MSVENRKYQIEYIENSVEKKLIIFSLTFAALSSGNTPSRILSITSENHDSKNEI